MQKTPGTLTKTMANKTRKITPPVPRHTSYNLTAQITDLDFGQCCSRVERIPMDTTMGDFVAGLTEMKAALRNKVAPSVRGAQAKTDGDYTIEITTAVTTPGYIYLVVIITRID